MYYVYILKSLKHGRHYIGSTDDAVDRLKRHNSGRNKSTKNGMPWMIVRTEEFSTKEGAHKRELQIKSYKNGEAFKKITSIK